MQFVWDEAKNSANSKKHKVSFMEAQTIFEDPQALRIYDPAGSFPRRRQIFALGNEFGSAYFGCLSLLP